MPNAIVTGAAGFIGSNLSAALMEFGYRVIGVDNYYSGLPSNIKRLQELYKDNFIFIRSDFMDTSNYDSWVLKCDLFVHLAAQVSVQRSVDNIWETHLINTSGFLSVLKLVDIASKKGSLRSFIYASSCSVYGGNSQLPLSEESQCLPLSPYAASKYANEAYATAFYNTYSPHLNITGLRFFNVYGPWQDPSSGYAAVVPRWIQCAVNGKKPVINGDGFATRDFIYVGDLCKAIYKISQLQQPHSHAVYNACTGVETTLKDLWGTISAVSIELLSKPTLEPIHREWNSAEIKYSCGCNNRLLKAVSGLEFKSLREGINDTLMAML